MSGAMILYFLGMALVLAGQRIVNDETVSPWLTGLGALAVVGALVLRVRGRASATHETATQAHTQGLIYMGVGALSLAIYGGSTDWFVDAVTDTEDAADRVSGVFGALWPIFWLAGSVPALLIDRAIADSPLAVQPLRIKQAAANGLISALGVSLVFPLNYLASEHNERFDFAYFKTTEVGSASSALVTNLTEPVVCRVFLPQSSDVRAEIVPYFEELAANNPAMFTVEVLDHAAEPALAETLKVRDNGYIALTVNDGTDDAVTKSWKVGDDLDKAKRNLKKLDQEFQKRMLDLAKGDRVIYFTVGHGELNWKGADDDADDMGDLKRGLQDLNFKVKELGLTQGLGDAVPDDADIVVVMGNEDAWLDGELQAMRDYLDQGGAVLIAAEPGDEHLEPLLSDLGLALGTGMLASEATFLRQSGGLDDRANVVTNRYSSHESTTTLSKYSRQLQLVTPTAGFLTELPQAGIPGAKATVTVRTLQDNFADLDGDYNFDVNEETKEVRTLASVVVGPAPKAQVEDADPDAEEPPDAPEFRAVVVADTTLFSDMVLTRSQANALFVSDALYWLLGDEDLAGTTENEEDVTIEHTAGQQKLWMLGSPVLVPILVLLGGVLHVSRRRRKSPAPVRQEVK